jgi:hypothetical protein
MRCEAALERAVAEEPQLARGWRTGLIQAAPALAETDQLFQQATALSA